MHQGPGTMHHEPGIRDHEPGIRRSGPIAAIQAPRTRDQARLSIIDESPVYSERLKKNPSFLSYDF